MNPDTLRSFDRLLSRLDRQGRTRRGGISTAPAVLAVGLILGNLILTRLVPVVWESLLPHGLAQAATLRGWPGLVWHSAVFCHAYPQRVWVVIGSIVAGSLLISYYVRPLRFLVWLSALGVIVANAGILVVTLKTGLNLTAGAAGF